VAISVTDYRVPGPVKTKGTFSALTGVDVNQRAIDFMHSDLAKSGLEVDDVAAKPQFMTPEGVICGYFIPYFTLEGDTLLDPDQGPLFYRCRHELPVGSDRPKYLQPKRESLPNGLHNIPYIYPELWNIDHDTLVIAEGEKKTACVTKYTGYPAIGIGGKDNWRAPGNRLADEAHPWIVEVLRTQGYANVLLIPDGDYRRHDVALSWGTLANVLRRTCGVDVRIIQFPDTNTKIDDLIVDWLKTESSAIDMMEATISEHSTTDFREASSALVTQYGLVTKQVRDRAVVLENDVNIGTLLREHPAFKPLWFNLDCNKVYYEESTLEEHNTDILHHFQRNLGMPTAKDNIVRREVGSAARSRSSSPFLDAIPEWDGTERLATMFQHYCGSPDTEIVNEVNSKWLIAALQRLTNPGCIVDYMVIAVGAQAIGKSSFPVCLWGVDNVKNVSFHDDKGKDLKQKIHSGLCANFEELAGLRDREIDWLKSFVTDKVDTFRPPYGRSPSDNHRRFVFYGSVNNAQFLRQDPTGQRRFAVLPFQQVKFKALERDREQLWAEARATMYDVRGWSNIDTAAEDSKQYVEDNEYYDTLMTTLFSSGKLKDIPTVMLGGQRYYRAKKRDVYLIAFEGGTANRSEKQRLEAHMLADGWSYYKNVPLNLRVNEGDARYWYYLIA